MSSGIPVTAELVVPPSEDGLLIVNDFNGLIPPTVPPIVAKPLGVIVGYKVRVCRPATASSIEELKLIGLLL